MTISEDSSNLSPDLVAALGHLHYGLYFLTTGGPENPQGLLVSWVSQVSGGPPQIMVAVRHNRASLGALRDNKTFALNLLPSGNRPLVGDLARTRASRFEGLALEEGPLGLPVLSDGLGALCCSIERQWQPGDHVLLCGPVEGVVWRGGGNAFSAAEVGHAYLGLS